MGLAIDVLTASPARGNFTTAELRHAATVICGLAIEAGHSPDAATALAALGLIPDHQPPPANDEWGMRRSRALRSAP